MTDAQIEAAWEQLRAGDRPVGDDETAVITRSEFFTAMRSSAPQEPDDALIEAETYRQMHETARELGYPSILEALEALSRLQAPPVADDDAEWLLNYADSVLDGSVMGVREAKRLKEIAARIQVSNGALHRISEMTDIEADFDGFEAREIANSSLQAKAPETPYSGIVVVDEADFTPGGIVEEGEG